MGDPRESRKKYDRPKHPWRADTLEAEKLILKEHGLKNKKELWKMEFLLRRYRRQARRLLALRTEQARKEEKQLLDRLRRLNLAGANATIDNVLALNVNDLLNRRLQTVVVKKGLANTPSQARQFVVHGHITIGGRKITAPSYLVKKDEEGNIQYTKDSTVGSVVKQEAKGEAATAAESPGTEVNTEEAE